jgi:GNAT superfamily N-acetyltransferase
MNARTAFSILRATAGDAAGILECLRSAFEPYRRDYTDAAFDDTVLTGETIQRRLAEMVVFVANSSDGEIVGTIACSTLGGGEGHIRGMAVRPSWHGWGVGQKLLESAESELRERNCSRISLDTTKPLQRAIRFYERNGYRASGVVVDFFGMVLIEYVKALE